MFSEIRATRLPSSFSASETAVSLSPPQISSPPSIGHVFKKKKPSSSSVPTSTVTLGHDVSPPSNPFPLSPYEIVDDTSSLIQYNGIWFGSNQSNTVTQPESVNDTGSLSFASPFQETSHGNNGNGSLSFSFNGSALRVFGSGQSNWTQGYPTWSCSLDGAIFANSSGPINSTNNWALCVYKFPDGPHTFTLSVSVTNEKTFWFDHLQYIPSANVSVDQLATPVPVLVDSSAIVQYSPGWTLYNQSWSVIEYFGSTRIVQTTGSYFLFWFIGTNIACYGIMSVDLVDLELQGVKQEILTAEATYTIDNLEAVPFPVGDSSLKNAPGRLLFKAGGLAPGNHSARIDYLGNSSTAPLAITYIVQNGPPSFFSSSTTIHRKPMINGVIVLVFILLLLDICLCS